MLLGNIELRHHETIDPRLSVHITNYTCVTDVEKTTETASFPIQSQRHEDQGE